MGKKTGFKRSLRRLSAAFLLATGMSVSAGGDELPSSSPSPVPATATCAAFPDFKKPDMPMHRISRNIDPDENIRAQQDLLRDIGLMGARPDGRMGTGTRSALRAFLIYAGEKDYTRSFGDAETSLLRKAADAGASLAKEHRLSVSTATALHLAAARTGVDADELARILKANKGKLENISGAGAPPTDLFLFDPAAWLYMVRTHGEQYGLGFYADHIDMKTTKGGLALSVENPFIHRQILNLRRDKFLSAMMAAEHLKARAEMPVLAKPSFAAFDVALQQRQKDLITLGFDPGAADGRPGTLTGIALKEFQILHGAGNPDGKLTASERALLSQSAAVARADARRYDVPEAAVGAIRMASVRTGLDFGYMMELAEAESAFSHNVKAATSSATGLYQFIESTWHGVLHGYGHAYGGEMGLGAFMGEIEVYTDDYGRTQARIDNPLVRAQVIDMRKNPQLSALLSADFQMENRGKQQCYVEGEISRTDMYLAHFLGAHDAVYFINNMRFDAQKSAPGTFPEAAEYNIGVFYDTRRGEILRERSLGDVYNFFSAKFDKGIYEEKTRLAQGEAERPTQKAAMNRP